MMHTAFETPSTDQLANRNIGTYRTYECRSSMFLSDRNQYLVSEVWNKCKRLNIDWRVSAKEPARSVASLWTTSGTVGSKDCVLLFRLDALRNTGLPTSAAIAGDTRPVISTPPSIAGGSAGSGSVKVLEPSNRIQSPSISLYQPLPSKALNKKRAHASLSSSDASISSACDELADADGADDGPLELPATRPEFAPSSPLASSTPASRTAEAPATAVKVGKENCVAVDKRCAAKAATPPDGGCDAAVQPVNVAEMPGRTMNINYRFQNTETRLLRRILNSHGLTEVDDAKPFSLLWTGNHVKTDVLRALLPHQRVNHFPRSSELTRKDRLYKNIEKMQHLRGFRAFDIVPQSFMLPMEYRNLVTAHRSSQKMPWIVKPAASSRGRGIFLVHSPEQISMDEQVLVSRYIANPLCIDGHKCDVRLYVAVTSFDPLLIYMYDEGLVRLATVKYDKSVENLWNPCMHLCNYSINKYHSDYIKATDSCEDVGHKWSFSALLRHLSEQGCDTRELMCQIEDVIVKSIFACAQSIASACRMFVPSGSNCFELYGYDILIDDTLKPWLLEVNMSPSLGIDTPLDSRVKASVINDLMTLVGIPAHDPTLKPGGESRWSRYRTAAGIAAKCRRSTSSTEVAAGRSGSRTPGATTSCLTQEELRIVRHARTQYERRGGFVRIYPQADSWQRYGQLMDPVTGIPMSTVTVNGISTCSMILPHNYNQMLFQQLYPGRISKRQTEAACDERMAQYERTLQADAAPLLLKRHSLNSGAAERDASVAALKARADEAKQLRRQLRRLIEVGAEMSQLQCRRLFQRYLETVLERLAAEPSKCSQHEKSVLKFITRADVVGIKAPSFIRNPTFPQQRVLSKDRSALVAKLLGDYVELYHRDSEAYVDDFDRPGIVPRRQFDEFLAVAQEQDIESVLTLHTNVTQSLPFLTTRCSYGVQTPPPIPTGPGGFLRALPSMVAGSVTTRDVASIDQYYKSLGSSSAASKDDESASAAVSNPKTSRGGGLKQPRTPGTEATVHQPSVGKRRAGRATNPGQSMSTSTTLPAASSKMPAAVVTQQKRSVSQSALHRKLLHLWS